MGGQQTIDANWMMKAMVELQQQLLAKNREEGQSALTLALKAISDQARSKNNN